MIELLKFIFQNPDIFLMTLLLLWIIGEVISKIVLAFKGIDKDE